MFLTPRWFKVSAKGLVLLLILESANSFSGFAENVPVPNSLSYWEELAGEEAPQILEEMAHERALEHAEQSAFRNSLPKVKTYLEESFVRSNSDSGSLTTARVEVPLFNKTKDYLSAKAAKVEIESYGIQRRQSSAWHRYEMRSAFYELDFLTKTLPLFLEKQNLMSEIIESETLLTSEKIKPLDDLDRYQNEKLVLDESIEVHNADLERVKAKIIYLSGKADGASDILVPTEFVPNAPKENISYWIDFALAKHPDILKLKFDAKKQEVVLLKARREWLPEISAVSSYARDPRFSRNENQIFAGLQVRLDLWNFGKGREEARKEIALLEEASLKLEHRKKQLQMEIDEAFRAYRIAYKLFLARQTYLDFQKKVLKMWEERLEIGEVSRRDVIVAQSRYLNAEIAFEEARKEALKTEAAFNLVAGILTTERQTLP